MKKSIIFQSIIFLFAVRKKKVNVIGRPKPVYKQRGNSFSKMNMFKKWHHFKIYMFKNQWCPIMHFFSQQFSEPRSKNLRPLVLELNMLILKR